MLVQRHTNDSHKNFIEAELDTGKDKGKRYFLPNIPITPSDADCPIIIKRI
jgi:hypothetical protein